MTDGAGLLVPTVVGGLLAAAVLVGSGSVTPRGTGALRPVSVVGRVGAASRELSVLLGSTLSGRARGNRPDVARVQVVITQVAGLVRSGMPPDRAWASVDVTTDPDGAPRAHDLAALTSDPSQVQAVVAACRLAHEVGAPVAPVLDSIVATLVAAAESSAERQTALAAPRSSARLLLWLPAVGAALATALGSGPVSMLMGGGAGAAVPVAGLVMLLLGRLWTRRLVRAASPGQESR